MTKEEYYLWYRQKRVEERKNPIDAIGPSIAAMLKEVYGYVLYGKDRIKYDLTWKYIDKISEQLKHDREALKIKGEENSKKMWHELIYNKNPFIEMVIGNKD